MTRVQKALLLAALYLAQGLPYGFFTQALPVLLRQSNMSLPAIGLSHLLLLPWALKFVWAPGVDRRQIPGIGLRRSWLLTIQISTVLLYLSMSLVTLEAGLHWVLAAFLIGNVFAATQDIATDGLAVDLTSMKERGWANAIQVAGYRLGMLVGGGALLAMFGSIGWSGVMLAIALVCALCTIPVFLYREPLDRPLRPEARGIRDSILEIVHFLRLPGALVWAAVLLTYKIGHASTAAMIKTWLVDAGYSSAEIASLLTWSALAAGFIGAMVGGLLAGKFERRRLLIVLTVLQAIGVTSYLWPIFSEHETMKVAIATGLDSFTSGMATVCLFTLMMDACTRERAASDYTAQACLVVVSQIAAGGLSLVFANRFGYPTQFAISAVIGLFALLLTTFAVTRAWAPAFFSRKSAALVGLVAMMTLGGFAQAQESGASTDKSYLFHLHGDTFLASKVSGVTEIVPGWGPGISIPTNKGLFMIDTFIGKGSGIEYKSLLADYRVNVVNDVIPVQFLIGFHTDTWTPPGSSTPKFAGGWHFGGGIMMPLAGPFYLESEFRYRLSPGTSLLIGVGLTYVLNSGSTE
ncbi:MAG: MFS transporter [Bdellovibrionota bacterium]